MMQRSLGQKKFFFAIFGTFVENIKNVQNQPTIQYTFKLGPDRTVFYLHGTRAGSLNWGWSRI
jgi:hypothetical protein